MKGTSKIILTVVICMVVTIAAVAGLIVKSPDIIGKFSKTADVNVTETTEATEKDANESSSINKFQARKIAIEAAGIERINGFFDNPGVLFTMDNIPYQSNDFEVGFIYGTKEYYYKIRQSDGVIVDSSIEEIETNICSNAKIILENKKKNEKKDTVDLISVDVAEQIAFDNGGIDNDGVNRVETAELKRNNGAFVYRVLFHNVKFEFTCIIDAQTGEVISAIHG